jgi:predicted dehydrogenase
MKPIRLAFVGLGGMGQCAHLRNYVTIPDVQIVAAAELRQDQGREVAKRYGIPRLYKDHHELLAAEREIDGIVAIQQFTTHGSLMPELLAAKIPLITEKPLASSVEIGEKILAAQQHTGTPMYVAYHKRSDPATMYARKIIDAWKTSGEFGKMRYVRIAMPPGDWSAQGFSHLITGKDPVPPIAADAPPTDMNAETFKAYWTFVNYYIHQVNLLRHLLGENYRVLYADPTGVLLVAQSESGVCGAIEMATHTTTIDWQESAFIAFEKGWIRVELPAPLAIDQPGRVTAFQDGGKREPLTISPTLPHIHAMRQQAINFIDALRGEKTCLCEPAEALEDLRVARDYIDLHQKVQPK